MRIVALDGEVGHLERVDVANIRIDFECGEWPGFALKLSLESFDVIAVDVRVAHGVHKVARFEVAAVSDHACEQRIGRDIEGHAQPHVARTLIHLARQLAALSVHIELAEHMAGRKRHDAEICGIPGGEHDASVIRVGLDRVDDIGELIHAFPRVVSMHVCVFGTKVAPLKAVHGTKVALFAMPQAQLGEKLLRPVSVPYVDILVAAASTTNV